MLLTWPQTSEIEEFEFFFQVALSGNQIFNPHCAFLCIWQDQNALGYCWFPLQSKYIPEFEGCSHVLCQPTGFGRPFSVLSAAWSIFCLEAREAMLVPGHLPW